ncbi:hypothetical protein DRQ26_01030 [bacterium]|nr:MAG: hypothetical protein DRQ26_01030 [bacterium]
MKEDDIKIWNYGNYSNSNYGSSRAVKIGKLTLYFSYDTIVAFEEEYEGIKVCENVFSVTTGKHLNWLEPDKKKRLPYDAFKKELEKTLKKYKLIEE